MINKEHTVIDKVIICHKIRIIMYEVVIGHLAEIIIEKMIMKLFMKMKEESDITPNKS